MRHICNTLLGGISLEFPGDESRRLFVDRAFFSGPFAPYLTKQELVASPTNAFLDFSD
jgi:hypothetical protein